MIDTLCEQIMRDGYREIISRREIPNPFTVGEEVPLWFDEIFEGYSFTDSPPHIDWQIWLRHCSRGWEVQDEEESEKIYEFYIKHLMWLEGNKGLSEGQVGPEV